MYTSAKKPSVFFSSFFFLVHHTEAALLSTGGGAVDESAHPDSMRKVLENNSWLTPGWFP